MDQRIPNETGPRRRRRPDPMTGTLDLLLGGPLSGWAIRHAPPALVRRVVCLDDAPVALAAGRGHDVFAGDPHDPAFTPAPAALALGFPLVLRPALIERYGGAVWAIHPGLLPHGRGPHPVFWALWEGTPAGATLHEVTAAVGGGPIVEQRDVVVRSSDTGGRLQERVEGAQRELFVRWLPRLAAGERPPARPQPNGGTFHSLAEFEFMRDEGRYEVRRGERERLERCLTFPRATREDGVARAAAQE